ncbi:hypothetical protein VTK73DRAFT_492 [Phialemonium thermophilum]|uniref:Uncharacterized protein n=1 Tax=Phialemonium thermophilum TaxID=223376 RepID=A0ABR3VV19_9PEZI
MSFPALEQAMARPSSDIASPPQRIRSRTQSISSDRPSTIGHGLMTPPLTVAPEPCFIAASAASQIVTNDHDSHADAWYDQHGVEPSGETAVVSRPALQLVNGFLDQLLFNFLSVARSTSLAALRPAVSEVLKPKLAKDAINQADEELREYLGGGDDEETPPHAASASPKDWDLELVWKRTRLRCMVYSSLGDMEEEDEDYYMEQQHLDAGLEDRLSEIVSPAVAIFLTSILEFMGEQALVVAGQAAYHRMRLKYEKELKEGARSPADVADRIVVQELDMERVALDRTLGRLWRAWKKKIRSPGLDASLSRSFSRDSMRAHARQVSYSTDSVVPPPTVPEPVADDAEAAAANEQQQPKEEPPPTEEYLRAATIPLPIGPRDVDEIEVPGLVSFSDDEDDTNDSEWVSPAARPQSWALMPVSASPLSARRRSNSLPAPRAQPYGSWARRREAEAGEEDANGDQEVGRDLVDEPEHLGDGEVDKSGASSEAATTSPTSPTNLRSSKGSPMEPSNERRPSRVSAILSSAAALGNAAVVGVTAIAQGSAMQTDPEPSSDEEGDDVEDFTEEPQILTSSRISISGRSASPAVSEHSRPAVINTNLPVRSSSVHSLRLIDVAGPRSPSTRSLSSSVDLNDHMRNIASTPPIVEERWGPTSPPAPATRTSAGSSYMKTAKAGASISISEAEEVAAADRGHRSPELHSGGESNSRYATSSPRRQTPPQYDGFSVGGQTMQPIFGSTPRRTTSSPPSSPAKPSITTTTKVTILHSSSTSASVSANNQPRVPENSAPQTRIAAHAPAPAPPSLPERSPTRPVYGASPPSPRSSSRAGSIGVVSVERPRARTMSEATSGSQSHESSSSAAARQLHTSGSASTTTSASRLRPVRTSEDSKTDVARNFEELIQSDQTIQYTLTPESMRDFDTQSTTSATNGSPMVAVKTRMSEDARATGDRSRSSSMNYVNEKRSASLSRPSVLNSHPVSDAAAAAVSRPSGPIPRAAQLGVSSKPRANVPQARDARLPRESLADFAEFIRSTGPPAENGGSSMAANGGNAFTRAAAVAATTTTPNDSGSWPLPKGGIEPGRVSTTSNPNRPRLQAREPTSSRDDNSDLIDFIRRGPPNTSGNPRIPRAVAPFRTTMDSDQMTGAVGGKAVDAHIRELDIRGSETSTTVTDYSMPSVQSSANSQTGLLRNKTAAPGGLGANRYGSRDPDMPMPQRKTRRVRDPYAIDFSDEEDEGYGDDAAAAPRSNGRRAAAPQEESLADFLRNYTPPPEPKVQPFVIAQAQNRPKKKASAPSLMARLTRRDNSQTGSGSSGTPSPRSPNPPVVDSRSLNSRGGGGGGRGYIPIQVNMPPGVDKYSPSYGGGNNGIGTAKTTSNTTTGGGAPQANSGRVRMKKFEPREAVPVVSRSATSDLADFLRNSEPPSGVTGPDSYYGSRARDVGSGAAKGLMGRRKF